MILKAIKILPYLLPTTANVTMGVLNTPTRANNTEQTITIGQNVTLNGSRVTEDPDWQIFQYAQPTNTSYAVFSSKIMTNTHVIAESDTQDDVLFGNVYQNGQILYNADPRFLCLTKITTNGYNLTINAKNLWQSIGFLGEGTFNLGVTSTVGLISEDTEIADIYNALWNNNETNKKLHQQRYDTISEKVNQTGITKTISQTRTMWNDDDVLWDDPDHEYPNINQNFEILANQTCYIAVLTKVTCNSGTVIYPSIAMEYRRCMVSDLELELGVTVSIPATINYEIIDVPGLMFEVLTMPFSFISQAFNLTLFPGTPYSVNISGIFLSIIALLAFAFIIKMVIGLMK